MIIVAKFGNFNKRFKRHKQPTVFKMLTKIKPVKKYCPKIMH